MDQALKLLQENKAAQAKSLLLEHLKTHPQEGGAWEGLALAKEKLGEDASSEWRKTILTLQKTEPLKGALLLSRHPKAMDMSLALSLHTRLHSRNGAEMLIKAVLDCSQDALLPKLLYTLLTYYPGPISQHFVNSQLEGVQDPEWQGRLSGLLEGRA